MYENSDGSSNVDNQGFMTEINEKARLFYQIPRAPRWASLHLKKG